MNSNATFVVTTSVRGNSRSQIWNSASPLPIGHPFHWVIEKTESGVRVRRLSPTRLNSIDADGSKEIPQDRLFKGTEIELPHAESEAPISLRIHPVAEVAPAYTATHGDCVSVFTCVNDWVLDAHIVENQFVARMLKSPVFALKKVHGGYELKVIVDGMKVSHGDDSPSFAKSGDSIKLKAEELVKLSLGMGSHVWRFNLAQTPKFNPSLKSASPEETADNSWFKQALGFAAVALGAFVIMAWLWPKPAPETELIPPQVAKLILSKPSKPAAAQQENGTGQQPTKKAEANVVQAFRAKALQSAVSGLLKGGMTRLLAQSDLVSGEKASASARKLFDGKPDALRASAPDIGPGDMNRKVASIGGEANGSKVGYAKGDKAGVKGQGSSFVSMDIAGSSVEEGLTKDEVGEVIHRHLSEVRYCYESAMLRTPDIEGKLMVGFVIGGNGMVKTTEVKSSTLPDPRLDDCILRRLVTWKFPQPKGGIDVAVAYPFIFKTLGR